MAFRDLDEFLTVEPLVLPIGGKEYAFPGDVCGESWLILQRVGQQVRFDDDLDDVAISSNQETAFKAEMFGPARDEMIADGCTGAQLDAVFRTLLAYHLSDRSIAVAESVWNAQGQPPEVEAPNRAARRSQSTKATAKSTRLRGSTPGTTSAKKNAPDTHGQTSSSTGI